MFHQGLNLNRQLGRNTRLAYPLVRYRRIGCMMDAFGTRGKTKCSTMTLWRHRNNSGNFSTFAVPPAELKWLPGIEPANHCMFYKQLCCICLHVQCCALLLLCYAFTVGDASRRPSNRSRKIDAIPNRTPKAPGIERLTIVSGKTCVQFGVYLYIYMYIYI